MLQEINLYPLLPHKQKAFLTLKRMAVSYSIFLGLLICSFAFQLWGKHNQVLAKDELNRQLAKVHQRTAEIKNQYPMLDPNDMENSVKKLQQELEEKSNIIDLLSHKQNFSSYLLGVAKAAVQGMWLVNIQIAFSDDKVSLDGYASQSSAVQDFMNSLAVQQEFSGIHFQLQEVAKVEKTTDPLLKFIISTKANATK